MTLLIDAAWFVGGMFVLVLALLAIGRTGYWR